MLEDWAQKLDRVHYTVSSIPCVADIWFSTLDRTFEVNIGNDMEKFSVGTTELERWTLSTTMKKDRRFRTNFCTYAFFSFNSQYSQYSKILFIIITSENWRILKLVKF